MSSLQDSGNIKAENLKASCPTDFSRDLTGLLAVRFSDPNYDFVHGVYSQDYVCVRTFIFHVK